MDAVIIAFVSGKGGTGKSTTAVFVGGALASLGKRVLLVELDSGLRSVDIIAGVSGKTVFDIEDVLSGRSEPDKAVVESPAYEGLSLISAPYSGGQITVRGLKALTNKLRAHFDYILLDTAAGMGEAFKAAAKVCHKMILVLTPDPVALRDGRLITDGMEAHINTLRLVINRVDRTAILRNGVLRDLDEAMDTVGIQLLGVIPDSPAILRAGATGDPLPKTGKERAVYNAIARRIMGEEVPLVVR